MKKLPAITLSLMMFGVSGLTFGDDFLSDPDKLHKDKRFGNDLVYFPEGIEDRFSKYDSLMVDEPIIFLSEDSPYKGFKASDLAAVTEAVRKSMITGLTEQKVSTGNYKAVDKPGPSVLYVRMAVKDVYVHKNKRGLLSYTPVGIVVKGVHDIASETIDKTTLVEMQLEVEMQDSTTGEVLFAAVMDRGHRKDKAAHIKEDNVSWDRPGAIAEKLGRRLACRMDNKRLSAEKQVDCLKAIPIGK